MKHINAQLNGISENFRLHVLQREDDSLFASALKPLIKETNGIISELYTALAEAKREVTFGLITI